MSEHWTALEFLEQRFVVDGDSAVVFNVGALTARRTGRRLETAVMQLMTVQGGLIAEIRPFYWDTTAVARTLAPVTPSSAGVSGCAPWTERTGSSERVAAASPPG